MNLHRQQRLKHVASAVGLKCSYETVDRPYVGLEHIRAWTGEINVNGETSPEGLVTLFEPNDILFGKLRPYLAKVALATFQGAGSTEVLVLRPRPGQSARYLRYVLSQKRFIDEVDSSTLGAKMPRASWEFIGSRVVPTPSLGVQETIADFLDRETGRIDQLIEEKQRLVALLQEKADATVARAVTGRLEKSRETKPSSVPYLGDVPRNWVVNKLGTRFSIQLGKMLDSSRQTGDSPGQYLRVFDVQWGEVNTTDLPIMDFSPEDRRKFRLESGDLLVNEGGSYVGRSAIWKSPINECFYQKSLHRVRPRNPERNTTRFLYYVMWYATKTGVFVAGGNQTTIDHLTAEAFRRYRFAFPTIERQNQIADHLDRITSRLTDLQAQIIASIERLYERRAALITAAVTGQIDLKTLVNRGATRFADRSEREVRV